MKKPLSLALLYLFVQTVIAQYPKPAETRYIYHEWNFSPVSHEKIKICQIPFGFIKLIDNRFDSNQFLITAKAVLGPELQLWRLPNASKISQWLEQFLEKGSGEKDTAFISLQCFQFGGTSETRRSFYFKGDAFVRTKLGYQRFASLDKCYDLHKGYHSTVLNALNEFVKLIRDNNFKNRVNENAIYEPDKLHENIRATWANYAIYKKDSFSDGIYRSFQSFRNANPEKCPDLSFCQLEDSTYQLIDQKGNPWLDKTQPAGLPGLPFFGICIKGISYLNIGAGRFIPLQRNGLDFEWRLPHSVPQMPKILLSGLYANDGGGGPDLSGVQLNNGKAAIVFFAVLVGIGVCLVIMEGIHETVVDSKNNKMESKGIIPAKPNYRKGIIDMDTGNIVFH